MLFVSFLYMLKSFHPIIVDLQALNQISNFFSWLIFGNMKPVQIRSSPWRNLHGFQTSYALLTTPSYNSIHYELLTIHSPLFISY
jgi:hypothetical protein